MKTLSRKEVVEVAPGAARRQDAKGERLLDTQDWLDEAEAHGFLPVFAMQGATHSDADRDPKDGRHLVVAAREDGVAWTLLNSHDRLMRVWHGVGGWVRDELLIGHQWPIQRWRGVPDVDGGETGPTIDAVASILRGRTFGFGDKTKFMVDCATYIAKHGYIKGRGRPSTLALLDAAKVAVNDNFSRFDIAAAIVAAARQGNLAPSTHATVRRNVKGIRRPDAYWHMALTAWDAAVK